MPIFEAYMGAEPMSMKFGCLGHFSILINRFEFNHDRWTDFHLVDFCHSILCGKSFLTPRRCTTVHAVINILGYATI